MLRKLFIRHNINLQLIAPILMVLLITGLVAPKTAIAVAIGKFSVIQGRVDLTVKGKKARLVKVGDEVEVGDVVRAKSDSRAEIELSDNSVLRIAQRSRVRLTKFIVGENKVDAKLDLSRGSIQSVVKKSESFFGLDRDNKYEIHTPTAVCGVRGTDFFSSFSGGVSNFAFKNGKGYGYTKNNPDQVIKIDPGQAMTVVAADAPPVLRDVSDAEMEQLDGETQSVEEEEEESTTDDQGGDTATEDQDDGGESTEEESGTTEEDATASGDESQEGAASEGDSTVAASSSSGETETATEGAAAEDSAVTTTAGEVPGDTTVSTTAGAVPDDTPITTTAGEVPTNTTITTTAGAVPTNTTITTTAGEVPAHTTITTTAGAVPTNTTITTTAGSVPTATTITTTAGAIPADTAVSTTSGNLSAETTITTTAGAVPVDTVVTTTVGTPPNETIHTTTAGAIPPDQTITVSAGAIPPDTAITTTAGAVPTDTTITTTAGSVPTDTTITTTAGSVPTDTTITTTAGSVPTDTTITTTAGSIPTDTTITTTAGSVPLDTPITTTAGSVPTDTTIVTTAGSLPADTTVSTTSTTTSSFTSLDSSLGAIDTTLTGSDMLLADTTTMYTDTVAVDTAVSPTGGTGTTTTSSLLTTTTPATTTPSTQTQTVIVPVTETILVTTAVTGGFDTTITGTAYSLVAGTYYENDLYRVGGSGDHYYTEYFKANSDGSVLFGVREFNRATDEEDYIYLYDGGYWNINDSYTTPETITISTWTPGSNPESFYQNPADGNTYTTSVHNNYYEYSSHIPRNSGSFSLNTNTTGSPWTATAGSPAPFSLSGNYSPTSGNYGQHALFTGDFINSNADGGAYYGFMDGVTGTFNGNIAALYVTDSNAGGVFWGNYNGSINAGSGVVSANGSLYPIQMSANVGFGPTSLSAQAVTGGIHGDTYGAFGGSGSFESGGGGFTYYLPGMDWGVFQVRQSLWNGLVAPAATSGTWQGRSHGEGHFGSLTNNGNQVPDDGYWLTNQMSGNYDTQNIWADNITGKYISTRSYGTFTADMDGFLNPDNTWASTISGYFQSSQPLAFGGEFDSPYYSAGQPYQYKFTGTTRLTWSAGASWYEGQTYVQGESGWSFYYDDGTNRVTKKTYRADGLVEVWVYTPSTVPTAPSWNSSDDNTLVSFTESTYTGTVLNNLQTEAPAGYASNSSTGFTQITRGIRDARLGGLSDLWSATFASPANVVMLGEYSIWDDLYLPGAFVSPINSYNPLTGNTTILDQSNNTENGSFWGYFSGSNYADETFEGSLLALYLDKNGNAGFVGGGNITGNIYSNSESFEGTGSVFPIEIVQSTGISAGDATHTAALTSQSVGNPENMTGSGLFSTGATFTLATKIARSSQISGANWSLSVWNIIQGGTYDDTTYALSDNWYRGWGNVIETANTKVKSGYYLSDTTDTKYSGSWSNGKLSGYGVSSWSNWDVSKSGVSGSFLQGTYDPVQKTFEQTIQIASMDINSFLTLSQTAAGRDKLDQLNIPGIQIGQTTLASAGGPLTVAMTDVTFFTNTAGNLARLWATDNVSGTFAAVPTAGTTNVAVTDGSITATFQIEGWGSNKWGASLAGNAGNVPARGDGGSTAFTSIRGGAAGSYSGTTSGTFAGTGTGVLRH